VSKQGNMQIMGSISPASAAKRKLRKTPLSAYFLVYLPALFDKIKMKVLCDHVICILRDLIGSTSSACF